MFVNLSEAERFHSSSTVSHNLRIQSPDLKENEGKKLLSLMDEKVEHLHELTIQYPFSNPTFAGFPTFFWSYQNIHSKKWNRADIIGVNPLFGDSVVNLNAVLVPIKVSITPHRTLMVLFLLVQRKQFIILQSRQSLIMPNFQMVMDNI
jgi:hypothetical protein